MNNTKSNDVNSNKKVERKLIVIVSVALVFALLGIGIGVYGLIDGSKKNEQILDLQKQIDQLTGNGDTRINEKTRIKVISSSWSGWSENYKPKETESFYEIKLHEKYVVKTRKYNNSNGERTEEVLSFEVTNIGDDSVSIHTFQAFSDSEEGINLQSDKQDFVIKIDESLELTTPTMDEGDIFTFSLSQD